MIHNEPHPLNGQTVRIKDGTVDQTQGEVIGGAEYQVEDWWDRVSGGSWMYAEGNPAAMHYAMRTGLGVPMPIDDEVVYGKVGWRGHLVHVSELGDVVST